MAKYRRSPFEVWVTVLAVLQAGDDHSKPLELDVRTALHVF